MHNILNANKKERKKEQMSLIKFRKVCPLGWCLFRRCFGLFTSILLLFQTKLSPRPLGREASFIFRPFPPPLISVLISGCFFSLPVVRGESVAACPTVFSLNLISSSHRTIILPYFLSQRWPFITSRC